MERQRPFDTPKVHLREENSNDIDFVDNANGESSIGNEIDIERITQKQEAAIVKSQSSESVSGGEVLIETGEGDFQSKQEKSMEALEPSIKD